MVKIRSSDYRNSIELIPALAVRADDLLQLLNEHKPHIVHFCGHGNSAGEIELLDNNGLAKPVDIQALSYLFKIVRNDVRVVILNACYSQPIAEAITQTIDCAIGMNRRNWRPTSVVFAASFYRAIGFGLSVQKSFEQGIAALLLEGIQEDDVPKLIVKRDVDPSLIYLLSESVSAIRELIPNQLVRQGTFQNSQTSPPFQAIADLPYFVGRKNELKELENILLANIHPAIFCILGMGGVGKTALAAHAAHRLRQHFPDGVLWARVDTSDAMSILGTFANAFGEDISAYSDAEGRSRVLRQILADKRVLMVLDNVQNSEQVFPLLPSTGSCAVIITSRFHGLSVARGAYRIQLSPFDNNKREAIDLFVNLLGQETVQNEAVLFNEIADLLGHLPLAIDIVASRLAYESNWSSATFLNRLRQEHKRLDELELENSSIRLSFNVSFEQLPSDLQRFFVCLGAFSGNDFSVEAAASIAQTTIEESENKLRKLNAFSLIRQGRRGRYQLHPLVCDYVREKINNPQTYDRLIAFYAATVEDAVPHLEGSDHVIWFEYLETEHDNIRGALQLAIDRDNEEISLRLAGALYWFWTRRGYLGEAHKWLEVVLEHSRIRERTPALARVLFGRGSVAWGLGEYAIAYSTLSDCVELWRELDNKRELAFALTLLSMASSSVGNYPLATSYREESLSLWRASGDKRGLAYATSYLGWSSRNQGDHTTAYNLFTEAVDIARVAKEERSLAWGLVGLGNVKRSQGEYVEARSLLQEAILIGREVREIGFLFGRSPILGT